MRYPTLQRALAQRFNTITSSCPFYATRQQAWKDFEERGLPTIKNESYKYTPITSLLTKYFDLPPVNPALDKKAKEATAVHHHAIDAYHILLSDGPISSAYTQMVNQESGVQVLTFQEAYQQQHNVFLEHFSKYAHSKEDAFAALNTAVFDASIFIHIADNAIVSKPLLLYHCTVSHHTCEPPMAHPRLLIVAGKNSQASIITSWQAAGFTNAVAEVVLQERARLDYYTLQTQLRQQDCHVNTTQCYQAQHSTLTTYTFTWSGAWVRNNLSNIMDASYGENNIYGLYYLQQQQHVDNYTLVDHRKPHTYSNELYKGIITDASTGVFNGRICVRAEAQKTRAFQKNDNLLLSGHAKLHTKPQLEIWADDVKCSHGTTTGQIDKEQLFYLQTRGISEKKAQHLLKQAFVQEVIEKIPLTSLRTQLRDSLATQEK
ncbi:MAG: Fe-S cluster assembly protein SufD [Bacteroidota bacterium]